MKHSIPRVKSDGEAQAVGARGTSEKCGLRTEQNPAHFKSPAAMG